MAAIIRRLATPVRVAVRGRDGVGRRTVAAALAGAGVPVATDESAADVGVVVIAETVKPEDRAFITGHDDVVVLNKADLSGYGAGGPLALAQRRAAHYRALTGVPTVPMIALLADVRVDDDMLAALRVLAAEPADLTSTDAFVQAPHALPTDVRLRLLAALDRFGIAHALLAVGSGASGDAVASRLRALSQIDGVTERVQAAGAPLRYRRLHAALAELRLIAMQFGDQRLSGLLATDDTVFEVMTAAVDVVQAAGLVVDRDDDAAAHLRRAVHWRRYGRGPVTALHRGCAADITRGSLRLLGRVR